LLLFTFLYLIIVMTIGTSYTSKSSLTENLFNKFSSFGAYGTVLFFIFISAITITIVEYPGGFFAKNNKARAGGSIVLILLICILCGILFISNVFPELSDKNAATTKLDLFKRALLMLFGTIVSILIIIWLVYNLQHLSGQSGIISFIINVLLVLAVLSLIYKIIFASLNNNSKESAFGELITNLIFYIPCIFTGIFDKLMKLGNKNYTQETSYWYMVILAIVLFIIYFTLPFLHYFVSQQGGTLLINQPIYTNTQHALGSYADFNKGVYDYNYAISFWVFFDAFPPNTNSNYSKYSSILSYGDKPNVLYNAAENTLLITMKQDEESKSENKLIELDDEGNRIIYKNKNVLLQKWNNIIINYDGGVMDVFLNGELVKSNNGVVPYYKLDNLTVGQNNGYIGGLCNLVYHNKTLTTNNIYLIYNTLKKNSPPVSNESTTSKMKYKDE